ncbi:MAG: hypothetical protein OXH52_06525 [Gammaproteobacteria bacterium]|nr:hypothetical protein [Gammaproteobacteria bacterium]
MASGEDEYVNNRFLTSDGDGLLPASVAGLDGEGIPAAVVAPSVLVEELEIERIDGPQQVPILLKHPYFRRDRP